MTNVVTPAITTGWAPEKIYSVGYVASTGLITGLYGSLIGFSEINHANTVDHKVAELGMISEARYNMIGDCITSPHGLAFYVPDGSIKIRKIQIDLGDNTYIDNKKSAIIGLGNQIVLIASCVDENGKPWADVTEVDVKNMSKKDFAISFNGQDSKSYKLQAKNHQPITIKLEDEGRATLRFKVTVPELDDLWLAIYPEVLGLDQSGLDKLSTWIQSK